MNTTQYIQEKLPKLDGWCSQEKALAMVELIDRVKPYTVVEIGVYGGRSLIPQALAMRDNNYGLIYGIDPYSLDAAMEGELAPVDAQWWSTVEIFPIMTRCLQELFSLKLTNCSVLITQAHQAAWFFRAESIDILHIDGNHTELSSTRDVTQYLPKVKASGYIWFDDIDWKTTTKAVAMLDAACERVLQVDQCILFRKKL